MSGDGYAAWWHDATLDLGLAAALDLTSTFREGDVEVFSHQRLGWAVAKGGRLLHVEEDAGPRELLAHVPLLGRPLTPARVLLVGGGEGAVLHEVLKHAFVARVELLEPERALLLAAAPLGFAADLADPRVSVRGSFAEVEGGADVVLVSRPLHGVPALSRFLARGGVVVEWDLAILTRGGARWQRRGSRVERIGAEERYHVSSPLLPGGFAGFSLHTVETVSPVTHAEPHGTVTAHHYTPALHRASFELPAFWGDLP